MGQCCENKWVFEQSDRTSRSDTRVLPNNANLPRTCLPVKAHVPRVLEASHVSRNGSIANHVYGQIGRTYWCLSTPFTRIGVTEA